MSYKSQFLDRKSLIKSCQEDKTLSDRLMAHGFIRIVYIVCIANI